MTVAIGLLFLGERLTISFVIGAALIVSGVTLTIAAAGARARARASAARDLVIS
jgi:drug/metabolite transporter (DMT)-like permease